MWCWTTTNRAFSAKDKKRRSAYESYAPLDSLGRCGVAFACLCKETMPTEKRGEIGQVRSQRLAHGEVRYGGRQVPV